MGEINRTRVRHRVSHVFDTALASGGDSKSIKKYIKELERSVDIHKESMGDGKDFMADFGKGV